MAGKRIVVKNTAPIISELSNSDVRARIYHGDCVDILSALPDDSIDLTVTSPPYCMSKEYEDCTSVDSFIETHEAIFPDIVRATKPGGSICWQVGFHVKAGVVTPLDFVVHEILSRFSDIHLRNRIVWTYGHGLHCEKRFSGRYEVIMWYTKGRDYYFDLDSVRVRQKYPGKRFSKGPKHGQFSGNPRGKNPSDFWGEVADDVWSIPNVKANHVEKTEHPCQFPVALAARLIRALAPQNGLVLDPFAGVASSGVASIVQGRRFIGAEVMDDYVAIANSRIKDAISGSPKIRPIDKEIYVPKPTEKVAMKPSHFWSVTENE